MTEALIATDPTPVEQRQAARLDTIPDIYRTVHERLAYELCLHMEDADEIFARYRYTPEDAADLIESEGFVALMARVTRELRESGLTFKAKARMQAEDLLEQSYDMARDPYVSAAVRAQIIQWTASMAGHNPKEVKDDGKAGGGLTLSITFAGAAPQQVLTSREPVLIEQGD